MLNVGIWIPKFFTTLSQTDSDGKVPPYLRRHLWKNYSDSIFIRINTPGVN